MLLLQVLTATTTLITITLLVAFVRSELTAVNESLVAAISSND